MSKELRANSINAQRLIQAISVDAFKRNGQQKDHGTRKVVGISVKDIRLLVDASQRESLY